MREYSLVDHTCIGLTELLKQKRISYEWAMCHCSSSERHYQLLVHDKWENIDTCPCCGTSMHNNSYNYNYTHHFTTVASNIFSTSAPLYTNSFVGTVGIGTIIPQQFVSISSTIIPHTIISHTLNIAATTQYYACSGTVSMCDREIFEHFHYKDENNIWKCKDADDCEKLRIIDEI